MKSHGSPPCMFEALRSFESFDEMHEDPAQRILLVSQSIMASLKLKCSRYGKEQFHDFTHICCFWCQKNPIEKINIGGGSGDPCHLCTLENKGDRKKAKDKLTR